ncbi:MAG: hypothetical protein RL392_102 [Pseudomonadota bacterium]|jgi:hypothetical protein
MPGPVGLGIFICVMGDAVRRAPVTHLKNEVEKWAALLFVVWVSDTVGTWSYSSCSRCPRKPCLA